MPIHARHRHSLPPRRSTCTRISSRIRPIGFPTHTGEEFLAFLRALAASGPSTPSPSPIEQYLGAHPKALAFVQTPKPAPSSFARESFFGVSAMRFTNKDGLSHFGRYRIVPEAGNDHLSDAAAVAGSANFLFDELSERISKGPIAFRILAQLAGNEDIVDDATIHWPADRPVAALGTDCSDCARFRERCRAETDHLRPHPARRWHRTF